jgi:acetyltransferase-like isoleucine patch superfamily enzyme
MTMFTKDIIKHDYIHIGDYTYGAPKIYIWTNRFHIYIGKFCSFAEEVIIISGGEHRIDWISTYPFGSLIGDIKPNAGHPTAKGDICIGNDIWFGTSSIILSGVTIGDGAVIGAGTVVSKDVQDYEIVAGNPARHIRYRFKEDQILALKRISWWTWPIEKIKAYLPLLESPDIEAFIKEADHI